MKDKIIAKQKELIKHLYKWLNQGKRMNYDQWYHKKVEIESELSQLEAEPVKSAEERIDRHTFVHRHQRDCYECFSKGLKYNQSIAPELISLARKEIGYSTKTVNEDIYNSLRNAYKEAKEKSSLLAIEYVEAIENYQRRNNPIAYEWWNPKTGHCYVEYVQRPELESDGEYIKIPLYYSQSQPNPTKDYFKPDEDGAM